MPKVISHPGKHNQTDAENVWYQSSEQPFGYFEIQNSSCRRTQEDALAWKTLDRQLDSLSPNEIGERLWSTYRTLDEKISKEKYDDGTTASTTVYVRTRQQNWLCLSYFANEPELFCKWI